VSGETSEGDGLTELQVPVTSRPPIRCELLGDHLCSPREVSRSELTSSAEFAVVRDRLQ